MYEYSEFQKHILREVMYLRRHLCYNNALYCIVIQQKKWKKNLTLEELKMFIKKSMSEYVKRIDLQAYWEGKENNIIKYIAFFETTKEFYKSQHTNQPVREEFYPGFHFHLFITGVNEDYINELTHQLPNCITEPVCKILDKLSIQDLHRFILYHTKQMVDGFTSELILKNYKTGRN